MNIQSTAPAKRFAPAKANSQVKEGQKDQEQQPKVPFGDGFARSTSSAMENYGVYAVGALGASVGYKIGAAVGAVIGAFSGIDGAVIGGLIGTGIGAIGGGYGGFKLGQAGLEVMGNIGKTTLGSNPNVGKAVGQALWLGAATGIGFGLNSAAGVVGLCAAVGAYDHFTP